MGFRIDSLRDLAAHGFDAVIDVRSPAEFAEDRLPGAINLPALSDEERAQVGTIYVRESPFRARKIGAALVARNVAAHLEGPLADKDGGWRPLVYCWRGGQRSGAVAAILREVGWRAETVEGGYRSFRRAVVRAVYDSAFPAPVLLLDGNTGTAKTEVLAGLAAAGVQAIDLEGLARHRGSLLGALPGGQPAQKAFESALALRVAALDPARPVVVEAESSRIGAVTVPPALWKAMQGAPRIDISAPLAERAAYLTRAYGDAVRDPDGIQALIGRFRRLQGAERVARWQALAREGAFETLAAELCVHHYDPRYARARGRRGDGPVATFETERLDPAGVAGLVARIVSWLQSGAARP